MSTSPVPRRLAGAAVTAVVAISVWLPSGSVSADSSYTVKRGDSITLIARNTGVRVDALLAANGLRIDSAIHPGQVLVIPDGSTGGTTYTVRRGDGLRMIAKRLGVKLGDLLQANGLKIDSVIHPGQQLVIPGSQATPPVPPTPPSPNPLATLPRQVRDRAELVPIFEAAGAEVGLPVDLLMAIGYHESRWRADAVSSAGALGVCQVMPGTAAWVARDLIGEPTLDPRDPVGGIRIGAHLLKHLLDLASGDLDRALAMYAQGVGGVQRNGISASSRRFIDEIAEIRTLF
jgi:LysM repeat protein